MPDLGAAITARLLDGPATATELILALGISQPALSRAMQQLMSDGHVLRMGAARSTRYGLRRAIPGAAPPWPVFQVDARGVIKEMGTLHALEPRHYFFDSPEKAIRGETDSIPYFLQDPRPSGFLGRAMPAAWPELGLPARVIDWTDDHYLAFLTRRGFDSIGDLLVGPESLDRYLAWMRERPVIQASDRSSAYPALALAAMSGGAPGSSAHGEHPKFTALIEDGGVRTHVIVKFSPPRDTATGQRWADLLVAEHLAHGHLAAHGISACHSTVHEHADRLFLEVERFDRIGAEGRRGVTSLLAVDAARYGELDQWPRCAARLHTQGALSRKDADQIRLLEAFGRWIANSDRHFGNLSLFDAYDGRFELAPVYDMLPMLFAPTNDQLIERSFEVPDPSAETLAVWARARNIAESYWERVGADVRISESFRTIAGHALDCIRSAPKRAVEPP